MFAYARFAFILVLSAAALFLGAQTAFAQAASSNVDATTPSGMAKGAHPLGSYSVGQFDTINTYNGNVAISIPLASLGGRAGLGAQVLLTNNSRFWRVQSWTTWDQGLDVYTTQFFPVSNSWDTGTDLAPGWRIHVGLMYGRQTGWDTVSCQPDSNRYNYTKTLTRLTFVSPDGTEFEFLDKATNGAIGALADEPGCASNQGVARGLEWVTTDGTAATFLSDSIIYDTNAAPVQYYGGAQPLLLVNGVVILRDGTRYRIDNSRVTWAQDRNGNRVNYQYDGYGRVTQITDTLARSILIAYDVVDPVSGKTLAAQIQVLGTGGATRTTKIFRASLANTLRDGGPVPTNQDLWYALDATPGATYNPSLISRVELPSGHAWVFKYNKYAEVTRVETPAGGATEYEFAAAAADNATLGSTGSGNDRRIMHYLTTRRTYADAASTTKASRTVYSDPYANNLTAGANAVVHEVDYDVVANSAAHELVHTYSGQPYDFALDSGSGPSNGTGYERWLRGKEIQTDEIAYDTGSPVTKSSTVYTWQQLAPVDWATARGVTDVNLHPQNNPRMTARTTTLYEPSPNLVARTEMQYDQFNNVTDEKVFDYQTLPLYNGGTPGRLVRETQRTYVQLLNGTNYRTDTDVHLRSLVLTEKTLGTNASGVVAFESETDYEYDNYATDSVHAGLLYDNFAVLGGAIQSTRAKIGQNTYPYDSTTLVTRGNLTGSKVVTSGGTTVSSAYSQYDTAGNVVATIGPAGASQKTTIDYSDVYAYGFPTSSRRSVTDADGSTTLLDTSSTYDLNTGAPTHIVGANGELTDYTYADVLDRPTLILRDLNSTERASTSYSYSAPGNPLWVQVVMAQDASSSLSATAYFDGLGRVIQQDRVDVGGNQVRVLTKYDGLGRPWLVSNPYAVNSGGSAIPSATDGWTRTLYDDLGRTVVASFFDNAPSSPPTAAEGADTGSVTTSYAGPTVTVTDQAGRARKSTSDALGRIVSVQEPDQATGTFGGTGSYSTSYTYDGRGDLLTVTQGTQSRAFRYDELGRMLWARMPEQTATISDGSGGTWSQKNTYDASSNLLTHAEARQGATTVTTTYTYDELNRVRTKNYSNTSAVDVSYSYDKVCYGSEVGSTTGLTPPSPYTVGAAKGRLYAIITNSTTETAQERTGDFYGYDLAGRVVYASQLTDGIHHESSATYNLASAPKTESYIPTGASVAMTYNAAGQVASVAGTYGSASAGASQISYTPAGSLAQQTLGNGLVHKIAYNSRLQTTQIGLGTSAASPDWMKLEYDYGQWGGSGTTLGPQNQNNGNIGRIRITPGSAPTIEQYFKYDYINRLSLAQEIPTVAPDFTIAASPSAVTIAKGSSGTSTITTAVSGGFNAAVGLSVSGLPANVTASFSPSSIAAPGAGTSTMTITVGSSAAAGTYPLTVTGSGGSVSHTATVTLTVSSTPDFTISASPSSVSIAKGASGTSTVTTAVVNGFSAAIALTSSGAPAGTTVSFSPASIAAPGSGTSTMTLVVGASTATGTYPITVTGTGGGKTHTATVTLTVTNASVTDYALGLSGTSFVAYATSVANWTALTGSVTVEAWIRPATLGVKQVVVSKRQTQANGGGYELRLSATNQVVFVTYNSSGAASSTATSAGTVSTVNTWHHVSGSIDSTTGKMRIDIDGTVETPVASGGIAPGTGTTRVQIGRAIPSGTAQDFFSGRIDEVRISKIVRYTANFTASTTKDLATDANTGALWKMNDYATDPSTTKVTDASAHADLTPLSGVTTPWPTGCTTLTKRAKAALRRGGRGAADVDVQPAGDVADGVAKTASANGWSQDYAYDQWGNRTWGTTGTANGPAVVLSGSNNNRLASVGGAAVGYDDAGNMTSQGTSTYSFDASDQMWKSVVGSTTVTYVYDGAGHRVKKIVTGGATSRYVYGIAGEMVAEYTGGTLTKQYSYGPSGMLAIVEGTTVKYCTPDHLGTPRIVTGQSGATATLISRHDYFPYGEEILDGSSGRIGIAGYSQADNVNQRFTSYERDAETGLDFARARYFGSGAGRFSSIDPKMTSARCANPQTFNRYSYCANNPVVLVDPSGKDWYQNDKTHIYYYLQGSGARAGYTHVSSGLKLTNVQGATGKFTKYNGHNIVLYNDDAHAGARLGDMGKYVAPPSAELPRSDWGDRMCLQFAGGGVQGGLMISTAGAFPLLQAGAYTGLVFLHSKAQSDALALTKEDANRTLEEVRRTGSAPDGYKGGTPFENDGRGGGQVLPSTDSNGNPIQYSEWDVHPLVPGVNRGPERLVTGSDGSAYYTPDHYGSFEPLDSSGPVEP